MSEAAPGRLDVVRRFLNTVSFEAGEDPLRGPDGLDDWCAQEGFQCSPGPRLRAFREALRRAAFANAGHADRLESWQGLEPFAEQARYTVRIGPDGTPLLEPTGQGEDRAVATLLAVVYDAVRSGEWVRLKACLAEDCRWAFYDRSKNGSGTWCSMSVCGNRYKARRRRQRDANRA